MAALTIELLGGVSLKLNGRPLASFKSRKAEALLAYLVCQPRPFSRENLANTFWGDSDPAQANANLRKLLSDLRKQVDPFLIIERKTVAFDPTSDYCLDVAEFESWLIGERRLQIARDDTASTHLQKAMELYKGDFLDGFFLRDSYHFDEWAALERERLRLTAVAILEQLAQQALHNKQYPAGIRQTRQLLTLDDLNEAAHRHLMRLLARDGRRSAALSHYAECERILAAELDVPPLPETRAVYERIRNAPERPLNFPANLAPLVGRQAEVVALSQQLEKADGRLLTIVGAGGVGKTHLALAASADLAPEYRHGIYLVPLTSPETIVQNQTQQHLLTAVSSALQLPISGSQADLQPVLDYLHQKEILLLLDGFEQVTNTAVTLQKFLKASRHLSLIVTSRQPLQLPGEWLLPLSGLPYPEMDCAPQTEWPALQLFQQQAQRVRPDFALTAHNQAEVAHICQLVAGLPLGIVLAATAVRAFTPAQISQQLQQNGDFLASRARDLPPRQRSARALFAYAWQLLTPKEQAQFSKLTIFQGSFSLEAAVAVTQIDPAAVEALLSKSMLTTDHSGCYRVPELLRRYGAEKLKQSPADYEKVLAAHGRYHE